MAVLCERLASLNRHACSDADRRGLGPDRASQALVAIEYARELVRYSLLTAAV